MKSLKKIRIELRMFTSRGEKSLAWHEMTWEEAERLALETEGVLRSLGKSRFKIVVFHEGKVLLKRQDIYGLRRDTWIMRGNEELQFHSLSEYLIRGEVVYYEDVIAGRKNKVDRKTAEQPSRIVIVNVGA